KAGSGPFDVFKRSQQILIKHPIVLTRALDPDRHPGIGNFMILKEADDRVELIQSSLNVSFPGDSDYMRVGLSAKSPVGLREIVKSVVEEYFDEAVGSERKRRVDRLRNLEATLHSESEKLRSSRRGLKNLEDKLEAPGESASITRDLASFL